MRATAKTARTARLCDIVHRCRLPKGTTLPLAAAVRTAEDNKRIKTVKLNPFGTMFDRYNIEQITTLHRAAQSIGSHRLKRMDIVQELSHTRCMHLALTRLRMKSHTEWMLNQCRRARELVTGSPVFDLLTVPEFRPADKIRGTDKAFGWMIAQGIHSPEMSLYRDLVAGRVCTHEYILSCLEDAQDAESAQGTDHLRPFNWQDDASTVLVGDVYKSGIVHGRSLSAWTVAFVKTGPYMAMRMNRDASYVGFSTNASRITQSTGLEKNSYENRLRRAVNIFTHSETSASAPDYLVSDISKLPWVIDEINCRLALQHKPGQVTASFDTIERHGLQTIHLS